MAMDKREENLQNSINNDTHKVLSLYGGQGSAQQLFSSLGKRKSPDDWDEGALPNGIMTSNVLPTHSVDESNPKKRTFGETFKAPSHLAPLSPPRPSKLTTTRGSSVTWHKPSLIPSNKPSDCRPYIFNDQPQPTGAWLTYDAVPELKLPKLSDFNKKERDPATGQMREKQQTPKELEEQKQAHAEAVAEAKVAHEKAKVDALFASVYSSFAPDRDETKAVISARERSRYWYFKWGKAMYEDLLARRDNALYGNPDEDVENEEAIDDHGDEIDAEEIKEIAKNWVPPAVEDGAVVNGGATATQANSTEHKLQKISDLIETLSSYQHARLDSLPVNNRPSTGHGSAASGNIINPSEPTAAETEVYQALRTQLASLVSELPPYVLSKVGGTQLAELLVSTKIRVAGKNQRGTMEDDDSSGRARIATQSPVPAAVNQAPAYGNHQRRQSYAQQPPANMSQYPRNPYSQHAATRPPSQHAYSTPQYPQRLSSSQYQQGANRASYPQQNYPSSRPTSYADRFANGMYNTTQNHGAQANGYRSVAQQPSAYPQQYGTPQQRMPAVAAGVTPSDYRASQTGGVSGMRGGYNYSQTPGGPSPQSSYRQSYSTGQYHQTPQGYNQTPQGYAPRMSAAPHVNGSMVGPSPVDQASMINRQKAQVPEQQQQAQYQPQQRQSSGPPPPVVQNGVQPDKSASSQLGVFTELKSEERVL